MSDAEHKIVMLEKDVASQIKELMALSSRLLALTEHQNRTFDTFAESVSSRVLVNRTVFFVLGIGCTFGLWGIL